MQSQETLNNQNNLEKEDWSSHTTQLQNLLQSYNNQCSIGIKTDIDEWNRIESPEIHPCIHDLIFDMGVKTI